MLSWIMEVQFVKSGGLLLAMAAKAYSVPFIIIAAMFKLVKNTNKYLL